MLSLLEQIKGMLELQASLPAQVLLQDPVILNDARGRIAPFHLDFIDSAEAFMAVLRVRFQDLGILKIEREEFRLDDAARDKKINLKAPWARVFKV
jgi:hypothetical protein